MKDKANSRALVALSVMGLLYNMTTLFDSSSFMMMYNNPMTDKIMKNTVNEKSL